MAQKLPGHKWAISGESEMFFYYRCKSCSFETVHGKPLPVPYNKECKKI